MLKDNGKISIGRPEMIVYKEYGKCISVRLDKKNRYVYEFKLLNENTFLVVSCKGHHGDH
ncbi:MAG: hypothetical protein LBJ97_01075 [Mycoplasmataceae bacterium]|jgi:Txe/YoeB family toxin of Txe-Axe toxin-antitoxin module|nr:hypothetical protein [Mycoplasmataceae bacterium]